jgi:hypothetical protein
VYYFCIIFLYALSTLSFNVTFLYYPSIFLFCTVLPCIVSLLYSYIKFPYSTVHRFFIILPCFCIILPYTTTVSCSHLLFPYYPPMYPLLCIILQYGGCVLFFHVMCLYYFPIHASASSYGKADEHIADHFFHLGLRLRMCGSMLPLSCNLCLRCVHGDTFTVLRYLHACHMFCLSQPP